jgi:PKD repeat protein
VCSSDLHTALIEWGDGTSEAGTLAAVVGPGGVSGTVMGAHVYADDGVYTVRVTVMDDDGGVGSDTAVMHVVNVASTVVPGPDQAADEGEPVGISASFTDPGLADAHTALIDWDDGTVEPGAVDALTGAVTGTHVYADDGDYTVEVLVTDDDGADAAGALKVTVFNAAPGVDLGADHFGIRKGTEHTHLHVFSDAGALDTHTIDIDWGDGTPVEHQTSTADASHGLTMALTHVFADAGYFTLTVTVTDDDGGVGADTAVMHVVNQAPVATNDAYSVDEDGVPESSGPSASTSMNPSGVGLLKGGACGVGAADEAMEVRSPRAVGVVAITIGGMSWLLTAEPPSCWWSRQSSPAARGHRRDARAGRRGHDGWA